jgi:hypothetical protein
VLEWKIERYLVFGKNKESVIRKMITNLPEFCDTAARFFRLKMWQKCKRRLKNQILYQFQY